MRSEVTLVVQTATEEELIDGLVELAATEGVTVEQCRVGADAIDVEGLVAERVEARRAVPTRSEGMEAGEPTGDAPERTEGSQDETPPPASE